MNHNICWREGLVTAEDLSDRRPYLLRFHSGEQIPGPVRASCIIAEVGDGEYEAAVNAWHGQVIKTDPRSIESFCRAKQFPGAHWWRCKDGQEPYQVILYQKFP